MAAKAAPVYLRAAPRCGLPRLRVRHFVACLHAALPVREIADMSKEVLTTVVRQDEAKAPVTHPVLQYTGPGFLSCLAFRGSKGFIPEVTFTARGQTDFRTPM